MQMLSKPYTALSKKKSILEAITKNYEESIDFIAVVINFK